MSYLSISLRDSRSTLLPRLVIVRFSCLLSLPFGQHNMRTVSLEVDQGGRNVFGWMTAIDTYYFNVRLDNDLNAVRLYGDVSPDIMVEDATWTYPVGSSVDGDYNSGPIVSEGDEYVSLYGEDATVGAINFQVITGVGAPPTLEEDEDGGSGGSNVGVIAGAAVGLMVVLLLVACLFLMVRSRSGSASSRSAAGGGASNRNAGPTIVSNLGDEKPGGGGGGSKSKGKADEAAGASMSDLSVLSDDAPPAYDEVVAV